MLFRGQEHRECFGAWSQWVSKAKVKAFCKAQRRGRGHGLCAGETELPNSGWQTKTIFLLVPHNILLKNTLTGFISHIRPMKTKVTQCDQSQPASMWERQSIWRAHWCTLPCSSMSNYLRSWVPEYQSTGSIPVVLFTTSSSAEKTNTQHESLGGQRKTSQFRPQCNPLWMIFLSDLSVCLGLLMWFESSSP